MDLRDLKADTVGIDRRKLSLIRDALRAGNPIGRLSSTHDPKLATVIASLSDAHISRLFDQWEGASLFPFRPNREFEQVLGQVVMGTGSETSIESERIAAWLEVDVLKLVVQRDCLRKFGLMGQELCGIRKPEIASLLKRASLDQLAAVMSRYDGPSVYPLSETRSLSLLLQHAQGQAIPDEALRIARATLRSAA